MKNQNRREFLKTGAALATMAFLALVRLQKILKNLLKHAKRAQIQRIARFYKEKLAISKSPRLA